MTYILVYHKVKDYAAWRPYFDGDMKLAAESGIHLQKVFCETANSQDVHMLFQVDDLDKAMQFFQNPRLKELMHKAGVISEPEVKILNEV